VRSHCLRLILGGINHYTAGQNTVFNFADWDTFAKTSSYNKNAKVYLGVPAAQSAAGTGYVDIDTLGSAAQYLQKTYSTFGGIMMWYIHFLTCLNLGIVRKHGRIPSVAV
jgi:chitinase